MARIRIKPFKLVENKEMRYIVVGCSRRFCNESGLDTNKLLRDPRMREYNQLIQLKNTIGVSIMWQPTPVDVIIVREFPFTVTQLAIRKFIRRESRRVYRELNKKSK